MIPFLEYKKNQLLFPKLPKPLKSPILNEILLSVSSIPLDIFTFLKHHFKMHIHLQGKFNNIGVKSKIKKTVVLYLAKLLI